MKIRYGLLGAALVASAGTALATTELAIDINSLTATFVGPGPFGVTSTGQILLGHDTNSTLNGVEIDGVSQTVTAGLASFSGVIDLVGGQVMGGSINIGATDLTSYSASILAGVGSVTTQAGQGFKIDGLTFLGLFGSASFAGVDVTPWFTAQPLTGTFLTFKFAPDSNGVDTDSDIDLSVFVPTPMAAGMGAAGLLALGGIRRRR